MSQNIDELAYAFEQAKQAEAEAREVRLQAEANLIAAVGDGREGTSTTKTEWYKVSVTQPVDRKLADDFAMKLDDLDAGLYCQVIKHKAELNVGLYKKLASVNPDAYRLISSAVIATPRKASVKVARIESQQEAA